MMEALEAAAIAAVTAIMDQVRNAKAGKVDADAVLASLKTFQASLAANDAAADAALEARFGKVEPKS